MPAAAMAAHLVAHAQAEPLPLTPALRRRRA
jgi:hypothetical protein